MPPKAQAPLFTQIWNFAQQRKRDFFFAGVALFAFSMVVRREMMAKGVVQPPQVNNTRKVLPHVERKFGQEKEK